MKGSLLWVQPCFPKSENDVRLQATPNSWNPTGLPVGKSGQLRLNFPVFGSITFAFETILKDSLEGITYDSQLCDQRYALRKPTWHNEYSSCCLCLDFLG